MIGREDRTGRGQVEGSREKGEGGMFTRGFNSGVESKKMIG